MLRDVTSELESQPNVEATTLGDVVSRLQVDEEILWSPTRLVQFEHWAGHIPFAFWLVKNLRPSLLVELGTHRGNSYCAFCQAIASLGIDAKTFAVDTWQGDLHMPAEEDVLPDLRAHHDRLYGRFSSLLQMEFSKARPFFEPDSIDLIHFDGTHTYDAIRSDFETWLPALSQRAVALFHDTNVRQQDFGVWQFWQEISSEYPSFEFLHSFGLGVLLIGKDMPTPIRSLAALSEDSDAQSCVRALFASRGEALTLNVQLHAQEAALTERQRDSDTLAARADELEKKLSAQDLEFCDKLTAEETRVAQTLTELEQSKAALKKIEASYHAREADIEKLVAEREQQSSMLIESNAQLQTRDADVEKISVELKQCQAALSDVSTRLQARDAEIDGLSTALRQKEAALEETGVRLQGRDAEIEKLSLELQSVVIRSIETKKELEASSSREERIAKQLDDIRNSRSWRMTKPLRAPVEMVRNIGTSPKRNKAHNENAKKAGAAFEEVTHSRITTGLSAGSDHIHAKLFDWYVKNSTERKEEYVQIETGAPPKVDEIDVKLIAYYLPQFHPIKENDEFWGKGFTEWHNVARAVPHFEGHYQPRLPAELGYYDLRLDGIMERQVELAKLYGIDAFCFHFYWFNGRRLLETPVQNFLKNRKLGLKFSLCWANENWSRRWDGGSNEVLIEQSNCPDDDVKFIRYVAQYLSDDRYMKVDGRPVLTVYRPMYLPDPAETAHRWREEARKMGFPDLYLVATNAFGLESCEEIGFDALSQFPPHGLNTPLLHHRMELSELEREWCVRDYADVVAVEKNRPRSEVTLHPGVVPSWDNSPRNPGKSHVLHRSSPALFREWLDDAINRASSNPKEERFVFINAWNEWAESAYLEPDRRYGYAYLASCRAALENYGARASISKFDSPPRPKSANIPAVVPATPSVLKRLSDDEWLSMLIRSVEQSIVEGVQLPRFPSDAVQIASVGSPGRVTIEEAFAFYRYIKDCMTIARRPLGSDSSVLDFGMGWGRILRCFVKDVNPQGLHGVDTDAQFLSIARTCQVPGTLQLIDPGGELPYPDNSFDLVYSYSVFTHLPEGIHERCLAEISRILRPGGFLVATVQPPRFFDFVGNLTSEKIAENGWYGFLASALAAQPDAPNLLEKSGFVYMSSYDNPDYGDSVISKKFVEENWSKYFEIAGYLDDESQFVQAIVTARKPRR